MEIPVINQIVPYYTKEEFNRFGYCGPFVIKDVRLLQSIYSDLLESENAPHMTIKLLRDENVYNNVTKFCGNDLYVWRSGFFKKSESESTPVGWHHDKHFEDGDRAIDFDDISKHFSICFSIGGFTNDNGRIEIIPESHKNINNYKRDTRTYEDKNILESLTEGEHFIKDLPEELLNTRRVLILESGGFIIFHSGLIHRSLPFHKGNPRYSYAARFCKRSIDIPKYLTSTHTFMNYCS